MKKLMTLISAVMCCVSIQAQTTAPKKVGDYIESFTNNAPTGMVARTMQYQPVEGDFYCVNGKNRFTRALYGSHSDYRIETSDKPIFAIYKGKNYKSVRFFVNGVQLDEVEHCEARYGKGRRSYVMRDKRWGSDAVLAMECVAMHEKEGAYWLLRSENFGKKDVEVKYMMCDIADTKLKRNGDIGADKAGSFEPSPTNDNLEEGRLTFRNEAIAVALLGEPAEAGQKGVHSMTLTQSDSAVKAGYLASKEYFEALASRIEFKTPDAMLNTLGTVLSVAADGAWDGETWLHGAIGWRMPLAGWRAGYLGDVLGWNDRAISHFDAYANSQVTDVPPTIPAPTQDPEQNMARAEKKWGTQMYSNGYICRNPNRNNQMHHYDMNLNYMDELLWHFQYDADTAYMRKMWPVIKAHLAWEKRNFDPDNNHLYDAYCCIWASDALYYNGGEVTHSSAYNYRGNLLAAKIARLIGEDAKPYQDEADAILKAMNENLWVKGGKYGHWAEYKDVMGLKRVHADAALWSIYTPIDCGVGTPQQMYECTKYVDEHIPHIAVERKNTETDATGRKDEVAGYLLSTSDWMPYSWSINNVASAEIMHTALAFFEAGRAAEGRNLVNANMLDQMFMGCSPGNLGQISYYDAARGESYRDFGDNIGISARAIVQGLFGIVPQALDGECIIRPGFPMSWEEAEVKTPYLSYKYKRVDGKAVFTVEQHFKQPLHITIRMNAGNGEYISYSGNSDPVQFIAVNVPQEDNDVYVKEEKTLSVPKDIAASVEVPRMGKTVAVEVPFNASVTDIFRNEYLSPRPSTTSLEIPVQGIGEWCHPKFTVEINDSVFRSQAKDGKVTIEGVTFNTPQKGRNILFASLWDNYPDEVTIPVKGNQKAGTAALLLAGSTNHMHVHLDNAIIMAEYTDGTADTLRLYPPYNYCPIEQDYYVDGKAFKTMEPRPLRVSFSTGRVSRDLGKAMNISSTEVYGREIKGGAAQVLTMSLDPKKTLKDFRLRCLANDVVVGVMAVTIGK